MCDGFDNDCNGIADDVADAPTWYADADHDGYGDPTKATTACEAPFGATDNGDDCDDTDPAFHPGATEAGCDGTADFNCDGQVGIVDADGDGASACVDCDDRDPAVHPGADEVCDGHDDDCDGFIDNNATDAADYAIDVDNDGHGNMRYVVSSCAPMDGYVSVADADDCDDLDKSSFPGAPEACDGRDNDCNGTIDDGASGKAAYYRDADQDSFGDPSAEVDACVRPAGYVENSADCDDLNRDVNPAANEACTDTVDRNCDGSVGQDDRDGDGVVACDDCDDRRADVHPGAPELCDGVDNDCNGQIDETAPAWYADLDGDGHGNARLAVIACAAPSGYVASADDCDDFSAATYPGATEICDGIDDNCDTALLATEHDADGDGFLACGGDCDDTRASRSPLGVELCNGADDNCNGSIDETGAADAQTWFKDADGDSYGTAATTTSACSAPTGYVGNDRDCNDGSGAAYPGHAEICHGIDNDCDGEIDESSATDATTWYADADGDGAGSVITTLACAKPAGFVATGGNCDDGDATRKPGASELCNGVDDDCNGVVPANEADADGDGYRKCVDCNDSDAQIRPGNVEVCNGKDDNCNGTTDEGAADAKPWYRDADNDGFGTYTSTAYACAAPSGYTQIPGDCGDSDNATFPGATPVCDGADHDCDGHVDFDEDDDGLAATWCGGSDCDDTDPNLPDSSGKCSYTTCRAALAAGQTTSGLYNINPDGNGAFSAYCNMTDSGGGWTLVARMTNGCWTDTRAAVGTLTAPTQSTCAKYADTTINAIRLSSASEGIFWGYHDGAVYPMPATGRFLKIMNGDFNASDTQPALTQQCSCQPGGPWSATYNSVSSMAGVYNHSSSAGWECVTSGVNGCDASTVYPQALFLYQHVLHQAGTFPSNSHGVAGGANGWLYVR